MKYFLAAFLLAALFTWLVKKFALEKNIIDRPDKMRKRHSRPTALLGGVAIFLSFWTVIGYLSFFTNLLDKHFSAAKLIGFFLGCLVLLVVGIIDDVKGLPVWIRAMFVMLAAIMVLAGGVELSILTNPAGGWFYLDFWKINFDSVGTFMVAGDLLIFIWLVSMTFTTKILDGLDGLATGITLIGAIMVYFLTTVTLFKQTDTALMSLVFIGVCAGFLLFNAYPAKIFLGESGSMLLGFILGVLAIIAGNKFATALLAMAVPFFDLLRVIYHRQRAGQPWFKGDREHLHFRLVDAGFNVTQAVWLFYIVALLFGFSTLFLKSTGKLVMIIFLFLFMAWVEWRVGKKKIIN